MNRAPWRSIWLLVGCALAACATTPSPGSENAEDDDSGQVISFEEACKEESSLLALCVGKQCGLYPCREVMQHLTAGRVVRTLGEAEPLTEVGVGTQRYWGSAQELPWDTRPVLIIPWDHKLPLLPSQQQALEEAAKERNKPHEKHHIFPQMFRAWFTARGIDIDEYVMLLEVEKHRSIHRGVNGGPWNAAWAKFINEHLDEPPPKEEIFRYAGQLIYEFQLFGPVMPYWKQTPQPWPPGY